MADRPYFDPVKLAYVEGLASERDEAHADLDEALALLREADPLMTWRTDSNGPDRRGWLDRRDALLAKHTPTERDR